MPLSRPAPLVAFSVFLCSISSNAQPPAQLAQSLAPTGTLRAAFLGDNPVLGRVDPQTKAVSGPVADLVKEIARLLNVPYELIPSSGTREIIDRLNAHTADLGFFAYNAARAREADISQPWLLMPNTYLVRADSPLMRVADADRAGVHITAVKGDTQDVYLSANLKNNRVDAIPSMPPPSEIENMLLNGKVDAFAANRQRLIEIASTRPKLRVIADDYFVASQSIAVAKGDHSRLESVNKLLDQILASDVVSSAIGRAGLRGVSAAKPRAKQVDEPGPR